MSGWLGYWRDVRARVVLDRGFARALWIVPWVWARARLRRPERTATVAFTPHPAGPWYTLPLSLAGTGIRTGPDPDVTVLFDDRTESGGVDMPGAINGTIHDISKARVGAVFADTFGYALTLDPRTHSGPMVEKSDVNGVHDGRVVMGPRDPIPGMAYQRLVDTTVRPGVTEELRLTCVGGRAVVAVRKEKDAQARFAANYLKTDLVPVADHLSEAEQADLARFLSAMGLDFGSVDALRDVDGRLYVVDVNKTCMPVLALPWRALDAAMAEIGAAAEALILSRMRAKA